MAATQTGPAPGDGALTDRPAAGPRFAVVSAGVLTIAVTYGLARYGFGLFVPQFREAFGLGAGEIGLLATGAYATYLAATALIAWLAPRLGLRRPVLVSGALAAGGMGLIAIARDPFTLTAGVLVAGASSGIAYPPFSQAVKRLLHESHQSTAVSLINSGTSYGVLVSGPLALIAGGQWRLAWVLFALLAVAATLWSAVVLPRDAPIRRADEPLGGASTALLSRRSIALFGAALTIGFGTSVYWTFAVDLVSRAGSLPSEAGRILVVLIGVAGIIGGFTGVAVRRFGPRKTFCASTAALGGALLLLALEAGAWAPVGVSGGMFGAAYFAATACLGMWSLRLFPDRPAAGFGATYFLISVGQLIGPFPAGLLAEAAGLESAFYVGAALTLATLLFARPREEPEERPSPCHRAGALPRAGQRGSLLNTE